MKSLTETISSAKEALKEAHQEKVASLSKIAELESELSKFAAAKELTFRLWKLGAFPAEDLETKLGEFLSKSTEELDSFEKAASLMNDPRALENFGIGTLSGEHSASATPEDRFLEVIYDD